MLDQKTREHSSEVHDRGGRSKLVGIVAVLGAVVIGLGIWALIGSSESDELSAATDLAEKWGAAWSGLDPEAVVALYTADGIHVPPAGWALGEASGRDELRTHATGRVDAISDVRLTGEVAAIGGSRYTVPVEFRASGATWVGDVRFEMEGDLISRAELLNVEVKGS